MAQTRNQYLATTFYERAAQADIAGLADLLHDDLTWWTAGGNLFAYAGRWRKPDIVAAFESIGPAFSEGPVWTFKSFVEQGDAIAFEVDVSAVTLDGRPYDNTYHIRFAMKDGLIHDVREHLDTLYGQKVLAGEGAH